MEYGIIVACMSLFGTFVLAMADAMREGAPAAPVRETPTSEWRQAA